MATEAEACFTMLRQPGAPLRGLVSRIGGYQENGRRLLGVIEMASLVVPLIISFGAPYAIALGRAPRKGDDYASFTAGIYPGHVVIDSTGRSACIQIDFTPLGAYRFFGPPMHAISARMVHLDDLRDADIAVLRRRLEDIEDWNRRLHLAEAFVVERLRHRRAVSAGVASAYRELACYHGNVRVAAIARRLDWSRKHLAQRFHEEIGVSPKQVARILRFNRLLDVAQREESPDWAGLAAECGYADQAHMTREFAEFAGTTPTRWQMQAA